ncbi:MAG: histidine--tRNA ligase [Parcubacteria bacterium C7867-001]|nr:MAG: histidine--tRNA ligase [Parcubacteria bacterium C7867-001]
MKGELSTEPYKGVRDFYPEDWAALSSAFETLRRVLKSYGYEEYNASPLEPASLYESKTSEEIVNEQTYTFTDRGDRKVTLRPEMTPTLARMVAAKRRELAFPVRWFSIPNVFRYERPQRGRLREHYQLNVDLLGMKDAKADGEIIVIASKLLRAFGAQDKDFSIRISSRSLLDAACNAAGFRSSEEKDSYRRLLDRKAKMPKEEFEAALEGRPDPLSLIESADDAEIAKEKDALLSLIEAFNARSMTNVVFDPEIVRGFDYYTGLVFEVFDTNPENSRSLFGGGRYDNLVGMFGGDAIPAIGFGMGDVTLMDFLTTHGIAPVAKSAATIYIGTPSEEDIAPAQTLADTLRDGGVSVIVHVGGKSLGDQIREADKRGNTYFIAYGKDEQSSGEVRLKELESGEETTLPISGVAAHLAK